MPKIDGVVVLYNPHIQLIANIDSYIDFVGTLFVIDNSEKKNYNIINELNRYKNIVYIDNNGNQGIAQALNLGAKLAIENVAKCLLTMDQDSKFENNDLGIMIDWIKNNNIDNIGLISPMHSNDEEILNKFHDTITMTSGNIVNLDILKRLGYFDEKLFIDSVDSEYCLRLMKYDISIKRVYNVILDHNLGEMKIYKVFGFLLKSFNHNAIRRYYMMRNRMYIYKKYYHTHPKFIKSDMRRAIVQFIKIIFLERDKLSKIRYTFKGIIDYYKGNFGKLSN